MAEASTLIESIKKDFKEEHFEEGASISDAAVNAIQRFESILRRAKEANIAFIFRHSETRKIRIVRVKEIKTDEILILEASAKIGTQTAINFSTIAEQNYKKMGIEFQDGPIKSVKKRHIQLMSQNELRKIRETSVLPISFEYYFENPHRRNNDFFEQWLPRSVSDITKCSVINDTADTVHLALEHRPEVRRSEIISLVKTLLKID